MFATPVSKIGKDATTGFGGLKITSVILPSNILVISSNAFKDCAQLTKININENCKEIGESAFSGCNVLNDITIDSSYAAYLTDNNSCLYSKSGAVVKVLTSLITDHKTEFQAGYLYQHSTQGSTEGDYTTFTINNV